MESTSGDIGFCIKKVLCLLGSSGNDVLGVQALIKKHQAFQVRKGLLWLNILSLRKDWRCFERAVSKLGSLVC